MNFVKIIDETNGSEAYVSFDDSFSWRFDIKINEVMTYDIKIHEYVDPNLKFVDAEITINEKSITEQPLAHFHPDLLREKISAKIGDSEQVTSIIVRHAKAQEASPMNEVISLLATLNIPEEGLKVLEFDAWDPRGEQEVQLVEPLDDAVMQ